MNFFHFLIGISLGFGAIYVYNTTKTPVKVEAGPRWFGSGSRKPDNEKIVPFKVNVPQDLLDDLNLRLSSARISHSPLEDSNDFWYGFNGNYLAEIKDYWLKSFDWRKQEAKINQFKQFKTQIDGLNIHFIHEKPSSAYKTVLPLLIVHGWPGNVFEFYKIIPMLTDPKAHGIKTEIAFEVIAPSIPGYGWSDQPKKTGFSSVEAARVFKILMNRIGYKKFYVQAGDFGSIIVANLAKLWPESVNAVHLNTVIMSPGASLKGFFIDILASYFPKFFLSSAELHDHNFFQRFSNALVESGYFHIQATKPDTVGTALNDSPIGLAAYILEKFSTATNEKNRALPDGGLTKKFTMDELLTIVMVYWTNGNIFSATRLYREFFLDKRQDELARTYLSAPVAHASGMNEMFDRTPIELSSTLFNITHYTEIPNMGHFACFEEPKAMAVDVFDFVNSLN